MRPLGVPLFIMDGLASGEPAIPVAVAFGLRLTPRAFAGYISSTSTTIEGGYGTL